MKRNKLLQLIILLGMTGFVASCHSADDEGIYPARTISGYVQKGPFVNGSSVTVYDLLENLSPTGKTYNTEITDNTGSFEIGEFYLSSNYAKLRADGYYFNEVTGKLSDSQLTLYALVDVSNTANINVNVLTHLEKARVEYLMNKQGLWFAEAKVQAQKEILSIFNISKSDIKSSESLDISGTDDSNSILLAVSAILQGQRSESELTELMAAISTDIKADGVLSDVTLGSELITQASRLDTTAIKANMTKIYSKQSVGLSKFGKYINNFVKSSKYKIID